VKINSYAINQFKKKTRLHLNSYCLGVDLLFVVLEKKFLLVLDKNFDPLIEDFDMLSIYEI
jgi:hypothetical protein